MEEYFYDKLEKKKRDRNNNHEALGNEMIDAGNDYGPGTSFGKSHSIKSVYYKYTLFHGIKFSWLTICDFFVKCNICKFMK